METTGVDDTTTGDTSKYKAVEIDNGKILLIPLRCLNDYYYLLLSDIQAMVPTATALLSNGKMIPFEIDTHSLLEFIPKRIIVKETDVVWQVYSPDPPPEQQQRTNQLEHKFDQIIQRLDQLVLLSSSEQLNHEDSNSHVSVPDAETNADEQQPLQSVPTSSISVITASRRRSTSPPPAFSSSPIITNIVAPTSTTSSTPSSPVSTSSHTSSPTSLSSSSSPQPLPSSSPSPPPVVATTTTTTTTTTTIDTTRDNDMAGPSTSAHTNITTTPSSSPHHHHDLTAAPPPSYETSIFGTIQALTQHIRRFEHHIPNRHKSPRWLARRAGWLGYEPTTIEQVAYQLVQLEMALLWTAVTESWIQERETWLTLVASARTERHLAGALVNLERHTLVLDDAWQDIRETWTRDLLELIVSVGF